MLASRVALEALEIDTSEDRLAEVIELGEIAAVAVVEVDWFELDLQELDRELERIASAPEERRAVGRHRRTSSV